MSSQPEQGGKVPVSPGDWETFRHQMPVTRKWAYFDHAAVAPLPLPARNAMSEWMEEAVFEGDTAWPRWVGRLEKGRATASRLLNAEIEELAWIANTTTGIGFVAEGLPWREGDNAVILANEFPSNQYPWLNLGSRGVETRRVLAEPDGSVRLEEIAAAIDSRTRIVSVSWVGFASGWRLDLDAMTELVHDRGVLLMVDAIQGLGVFPLDVRRTPVDFLAADGHKWLLGPEGWGLLYIRRDRLDLLRPQSVGWNSVVQGSDYSRIELTFKPSAARFEGGSQNLAGGIGLSASLHLLESLGAGPQNSAVARRVLEVTDFACERLRQAGARIPSERSPKHSSGIVSFDWPGEDPSETRKRLLARHVVLSCRGGRLRISPHAYNDASDVERLIAALQCK